jgi:Fe-S cluster biogenesis protein NfuA
MVPRVQDEVEHVLAELIRPLIEADGGEVELRSVDENKTPVEITLVVGGAYRGCPGTPLVAKSILEPAFAKALGREVRVRTVPRLS